MANKMADGRGRGNSRAGQLRKRLRKAEGQLRDAMDARDEAQARVEALSIIAEEVRAQLAEARRAGVSGNAKGASVHRDHVPEENTHGHR